MSDDRAIAHGVLKSLIQAPEAELHALLSAHLTPDTVWDVAYPINRLEGVDAVLEGLVLPLRRALPQIRRRDEIFIGGRNRRGSENPVHRDRQFVGGQYRDDSTSSGISYRRSDRSG